MKILLVHNYYRSSIPSGENQVFDAECRLLKLRRHQVRVFARYSDDIIQNGVCGTLHGAVATPLNPWSAAFVRHEVKMWQPDVVHVHNTFPLISPAIFRLIGNDTAKVLTLHNYRLFCPSAILMRNGSICTACLDNKSVWRSVVYGCYRGSHLATVPLAVTVALHRIVGTWSHHVEAFIALSEFQKHLMVNAGLPAHRVHVKPNFYPGKPKVVPWANRGEYAVFAGRLSSEKGIENLVRAWLGWGRDAPELRIIGGGPLRGHLKRLLSVSAVNNIVMMDPMSVADVEHQIGFAKLLVLPSVCYEGFPMTVLTALASGTPAAVSKIGPLPSIIQDGKNGVVFSPREPVSLLEKIRAAWKTPGHLERLGRGARYAFETQYTEKINYDMLIGIYQSAIENLQS